MRLFEDELDLPSGIAPMENDECQIDPAVFGVFVNVLVDRLGNPSHAVLRALSEGFVATTVALAGRAGIEVPAVPADLLERSRELDLRMVR